MISKKPATKTSKTKSKERSQTLKQSPKPPKVAEAQTTNEESKPIKPEQKKTIFTFSEDIIFSIRMLHYIFKYKFVLTWALLSLILTPYLQGKLSEIGGEIIDSVILRHNSVEMDDIVTEFLLACILYSILEFFYSYLFNILSTRIQITLKEEVYSGIMRRNLPYFEKSSPSDVINHVDGQIYAAQNIFTKDLSNLLRNIIMVLYSSWTLITISSRLTLFVITVAPVYLILSFGYSTYHGKAAKEETDALTKARIGILETFTNIKLVKSSSTELNEIQRYQSLLQESKNKSYHKAFVWSLNTAITEFLAKGTFLLVIYMGMTLINVGEITPGGLSSYFVFVIFLSSGFKDASTSYDLIKGSFPICKDLFNLLDSNSKVAIQSGNIISNFQGNISFKNVSFSFPLDPNAASLKNVSCNIAKGEKIAFVGPKNTGKSTIISLLLKFNEEFKGDIKLDGIDIRKLDTKWLHQQVGYVSQEPEMFNGTIEQNIAYGIEGYSKEKLLKVVRLANADFIFNRNIFPGGLQSNIQEELSKLSGGQKQRLAIARALMKDPKILIFEEPMNHLDSDSELEVQQAIDNLVESWQVTTIIVAQKTTTVTKVKTIFFMDDGKIVEQGSHKELMAKGGMYKGLYEKQWQPKNELL